MTLLSMTLHISSLIILLLFPSYAIAEAGELSLYYDPSCTEQSTFLPKISLNVSTCLIPDGVFGVVVNSLPPCPNGGSASIIIYKDACSQVTKNKYKDCFYYFVSSAIGGIMFTCDDPDTLPQPTSSETATATRIAGVATGSPATSVTTSEKTSVSTTATDSGGGGGGSPTSSGNGNKSTGTSSVGSESTGTSSSGSGSSTSSSGLSKSDRIAIGVGLGIGVPTILLGLAAWLWPRYRPG